MTEKLKYGCNFLLAAHKNAIVVIKWTKISHKPYQIVRIKFTNFSISEN